VLLVAGGKADDRRERLGAAPFGADQNSAGKVRVWLHAASVGEIEGVSPLVRKMRHLLPDVEFVTTTMTPTGRDAARRRLNLPCQLAPFDHPAVVRSFVARTRPSLLIVTETELWPNLLLQCAAAGVAVALINARVSRRSMNRYRLIRPLIARALQSANMVLAQTDQDAERFCQLGAAPERVAVTGNTKYEITDAPGLRAALATFATGQPILVAGSTAPGEEQIVLTAYRELLRRFPSLALVLAPRHLERLREVERILRAIGLTYLRASEMNLSSGLSECMRKTCQQTAVYSNCGENPISFSYQGRPGRSGLSADHDAEPLEQTNLPVSYTASGTSEPLLKSVGDKEATSRLSAQRHEQVLLLDTMGELSAMYRRASVALVGGSMVSGRGGQSLAEPANASVPVLFGPYYENHRQLGDALIAAKAGRVVHDASELVGATAEWLNDPSVRTASGQRARSVIEQFAGGTIATVDHICALLGAS
jgi:3-deoxy-D-manno-octulosonic-acid transferase